jgi:hypothetical protein
VVPIHLLCPPVLLDPLQLRAGWPPVAVKPSQGQMSSQFHKETHLTFMLLPEACQTFYIMIDAHPRVDTLQQDSMLPSICALSTAVRHLVVDAPRVPSR